MVYLKFSFLLTIEWPADSYSLLCWRLLLKPNFSSDLIIVIYCCTDYGPYFLRNLSLIFLSGQHHEKTISFWRFFGLELGLPLGHKLISFLKKPPIVDQNEFPILPGCCNGANTAWPQYWLWNRNLEFFGFGLKCETSHLFLWKMALLRIRKPPGRIFLLPGWLKMFYCSTCNVKEKLGWWYNYWKLRGN